MSGYAIKQNSSTYDIVFFMRDSSDHVSGKTGLSPTVTLRKQGGSFASPSGAVTEIANGWYKVAGNATDSNTLGPLLFHATGTGADPCDGVFLVVSYDPFDATRLGLSALPNANAGANNGVPLGDANGRVQVQPGTGTGQIDLTAGVAKVNLAQILATALTEGGSGRLAAAFQTLFNVASPVLTAASINQTGDNYAKLTDGTFGLNALLSAILNIQNGTYVSASTPAFIEKPDTGTVAYRIRVVFSDETGTLKNLDSGSPTIAVTDETGASLAANVGSWTNPQTGVYDVTYTASSSHTYQVINWFISGTINSKLRAFSSNSPFVDTNAVDFTSADRTKLNQLASDYTTARAAKIDNLDATVSSRSTYAGGDTSGVTTLLARLTDTRALLLDNLANLDALISSRSTYSGSDTAGTTTLLGRLSGTRANLLDNLANLDALISSRLAAGSYAAPPDASAIATAVLTKKVADVIAGLSEADRHTLAGLIMFVQKWLIPSANTHRTSKPDGSAWFDTSFTNAEREAASSFGQT